MSRNLSIVFDNFRQGDVHTDVLISLIVGYSIYFILCFTQHLVCRVCSTLTLIPRLVIEDTLNLTMLLSTIILWRVYYIVPDLYLRVTNYQTEVYFLAHFISFCASVGLNATVVITGIGYDFRDGEMSDDGDFFQIKYVASIREVSSVPVGFLVVTSRPNRSSLQGAAQSRAICSEQQAPLGHFSPNRTLKTVFIPILLRNKFFGLSQAFTCPDRDRLRTGNRSGICRRRHRSGT